MTRSLWGHDVDNAIRLAYTRQVWLAYTLRYTIHAGGDIREVTLRATWSMQVRWGMSFIWHDAAAGSMHEGQWCFYDAFWAPFWCWFALACWLALARAEHDPTYPIECRDQQSFLQLLNPLSLNDMEQSFWIAWHERGITYDATILRSWWDYCCIITYITQSVN